MADLATVWRNRTDDQVSAALAGLGEFSDEAQAVIRAEQARRGLETPVIHRPPPADIDAIVRLHRIVVALVALQWMVVLFAVVNDGMPPRFLSLAILTLLGTVIATPLVARRLLTRLEVDASLASMTYAPLFSLLFVLNFRSIAAGWAKRHGVEVGIAGIKS